MLAASAPVLAAQREPRGGSARPPAAGGQRAVPKGEGGGTVKPADGGSEARPSGGPTSAGASEPAPRASRRPSSSRPPDEGVAVARATPRTSDGPGHTPVVVQPRYYAYYPWGYGSYGFGSYWNGYYDPWYAGGYAYPGSYSEDAAMRIKVKPREATVSVDGYYAGRVDDFDGVFQRLHVAPGPHRVAIDADGYQRLEIDVMLQPGRTLTYEGELKRLP
jgi:hypothetical protein